MMATPARGLLGRLTAAARSHLPDPALRALRDGGRTVRDAAGEAAERLTTLTIEMPTADTLTLSRVGSRAGRPGGATTTRRLDPALDDGPPEMVSGRVVVAVPDPACLVRLASSGLLHGTVSSLRVRLRWAPPWLRAGAPGIRPTVDLSSAEISRSRGTGVEATLSWDQPTGIAVALDAVLRAVLRARTTPLHGGPLPAIDRDGWLAGAWTWPDGVLLDERQPPASPGPGPLAPFTDPAAAAHDTAGPTLVAAVAFPWRRRLLGEPAAYRLTRDADGNFVVRDVAGTRSVAIFDGLSAVERVVHGDLVKYATAAVAAALLTPADDAAVLALAAVGVVVVPDEGADADRARLRDLGLPVPDSAAEVTGVEGYAWSVAVSRAAAVAADPVLRHGPGRGGPVPTVSVLIASMRPASLPAVLADLAAQTWPAFEVLIGTHGWTASAADTRSWEALLGRPLRIIAATAETPFGELLGALSRAADGDVLTKVDDDDIYGRDHLTDLVLALRTTGADLVSKAPRFVHLAVGGHAGSAATEDSGDPRLGTTGSTVDRSWAASEVLDTTPAGGTLMFTRSTLLAAGGWSGSLRHVDIDVTARIRRAGGVTFRSHGLGYIWVRHERGHTWDTDRSVFLEQAGEVYPGLPAALATGRPAALR